jgi:hypothetical protein
MAASYTLVGGKNGYRHFMVLLFLCTCHNFLLGMQGQQQQQQFISLLIW